MTLYLVFATEGGDLCCSVQSSIITDYCKMLENIVTRFFQEAFD